MDSRVLNARLKCQDTEFALFAVQLARVDLWDPLYGDKDGVSR